MKRDESSKPRPDAAARRSRQGAKRGRPKASRQEPVDFEAGTVRAIRALDTRGARFEVDIDGRFAIVSAELALRKAGRPATIS